VFQLPEHVNKAGKGVHKKHSYTLPLPTLHNNSFGLSTQKLEISTVVHNLSPTGGKECQSGHFTLLVRLPRLLLNSGGEFVDLVIDRTTLSHQLTDFAVGVHNRGVVAPAECLADFWKREFG